MKFIEEKKIKDSDKLIYILSLAILLIPVNMTLSGILLIYILFRSFSIQSNIKLVPDFLKHILIIFFAYSIVQSIFAENILHHYAGIIGHYIVYILIFILLKKIVDNDKKIILLIKSTILSGFILSIIGIIIYLLPDMNYRFINYKIFDNGYLINIESFKGKASGISMNPNIMSIYLILTIFLSLGNKDIFKNISSDKKKNSYMIYIFLLFQSLCLFLTYSRGAFLTIILTLPFLFKSLRIKIKYLFFLFLLLLDEKLLNRLINTFDLSNRENSTRLFVWQKSLEIIKENPFGTGVMSFEDMYKLYNIEKFIHIPHAHNWYLQTAVESGIIGAVIFFSFFFYIIYYFFKNLAPKYYYIPITLITFSIFNLTDYVLTDTRIMIILTIIIYIGFYKIHASKSIYDKLN